MNTDTVFGEEGMSPVDGRLLLFALPPGHYQVATPGVTGWRSQAGAASGARSPCPSRPALTSVPAAAPIWGGISGLVDAAGTEAEQSAKT
jgi:hypothetical protein